MNQKLSPPLSQFDVPKMRSILENVPAKEPEPRGVVVEAKLPGRGDESLMINARRVDGADSVPPIILLAVMALQKDGKGR